jgi:predicted nucleotide-binding protein
MISRFQGADGQRRLILVLRETHIVRDEEPLATAIAQVAEIVQIEPGGPQSIIIQQGNSDTDLYLILAGRVSVRVNGREVAERDAGCHFGEMALIDPSARRSASVVATEQSVVARISEPVFTDLAGRYPHLWRRLALELGSRLRQRGHSITPPNVQPLVFIGSSVEGLQIAREIQSGLAHDRMIVSVWTDGVFRASRGAVESLLDAVRKSDFAVLLLSPDDTVISREVQSAAPRDNCIFELGLFMGALGRERSFIVKPRGEDIKLPSDLLGLTPLEYPPGDLETLTPRIAPICTAIRNTVSRVGSK